MVAYKFIMTAVEERREWVEEITAQIPGCTVVWDEDRIPYNTFLRALATAGESAVVMIQDDIILTSNFLEKIDAVIQSKPIFVIHFFSRRKDDIRIGSRWLPPNKCVDHQCIYYPPGYAALMHAEQPPYEQAPEHQRTWHDLIPHDFLVRRNEKFWVHCPNLVDHRVGVSAIDPKRKNSRKSYTFEP